MSEKNRGQDLLLMGADNNKDQTYFLWTTPQEKLQKILFPIGHLQKPKVRKLAQKFGLHTEKKKDSQGICFLGKVKMKDFLREYIDEKPGVVLDMDGKAIGTHPGSLFFTLGERHGFEIDSKHRTPNMTRLFVITKDLENNTITVGSKEDMKEQATSHTEIRLRDVNWISGEPEADKECQARIRYRGTLLSCTFRKGRDVWVAHFETPHESVATGQSLVAYDRDACIGGGVII